MTLDEYEVNPGAWSISGNIVGTGLGALSDEGIFQYNSTELLTENQRLVTTDTTGLSGYASNSYTFERVEDVYMSLPGSAKITSNYASTQTVYITIGTAGSIPATAGTDYVATVNVQSFGTGSSTAEGYIDWYNGSDVFISSSSVATTTFSDDGFEQIIIFGTAPTNTASALVIMRRQTTSQNGGFYYDNGNFGLNAYGDVAVGSSILTLTYNGA